MRTQMRYTSQNVSSKTTLLVGKDVTNVVKRHAARHGGLNGEISVAVDEVSAVEPSDSIPQESLLVSRLGLELGNPDGLLGQVVHVDDVSLESLNVGRAIPVSGDVINSATTTSSKELHHHVDTVVAVSGRNNGDIGTSIGDGLDFLLVSCHSGGNIHAGAATSLTGFNQYMVQCKQLVSHLITYQQMSGSLMLKMCIEPAARAA